MPSETRHHTAIRLSPSGRERIDELAHEYRLSRSQVMRAAIAVAFRHDADLRRTLEQMKETS